MPTAGVERTLCEGRRELGSESLEFLLVLCQNFGLNTKEVASFLSGQRLLLHLGLFSLSVQ